jgi:hypothetical protein
VQGQENRLLKERANEVSTVLGVAVNNISSELGAVGAVLRATDDSSSAFAKAAMPLVDAPGGKQAIALLRPVGGSFKVVLAEGQGLQQGQLISGSAAIAARQALHSTSFVPTTVTGAGATRSVGFAVGPPQAPAGSVVFEQLGLGALGPPQEAKEAPFSEVEIVLFAGPESVPSQALVSTAKKLPLTGTVRSQKVPAGTASWRLEVRAVHPLVGTAAANAPWIVSLAGLVLSILLTTIIEIESRRRSSALALYDSEHRLAVQLQRELLPILQTPEQVQVCAHYLPGSIGQQVGGDWYDLFQLEDGRIGIVIGDVVGHDLSAAATMSRLQAALRAYAIEGHDPAHVLDRLDALLSGMGTERLATAFYGVLGVPDYDGGRTLTYANAGHPPPLVHDPSGGIRELDEASSLLLGTGLPGQPARRVGALSLASGATVFLYTDGLVEIAGQSIVDATDLLKAEVVADAGRLDPAELCDQIIARRRQAELRDDLAVLALRLTPSRSERHSAAQPAQQSVL